MRNLRSTSSSTVKQPLHLPGAQVLLSYSDRRGCCSEFSGFS